MEITLESVLAVLRKYLVLILIVALVAGILTFVVSRYFVEPTYVSVARLNIAVPMESQKTTSESSTAWVYANRQLPTCIELLQTNDFALIVREYAVLDHAPSFKVTSTTDSTIITITASDNDPDAAYRVAMTAAEQASVYINEKSISMLTAVLVDTPQKAREQIAPKPLRNVAIAAVAAALIVIVIELLRETMGKKVKDENELAKHYDLPVIAVIPDFNDAATRNNSYYYEHYGYGYGGKEQKGEAENG